jgi:hypothetical protein
VDCRAKLSIKLEDSVLTAERWGDTRRGDLTRLLPAGAPSVYRPGGLED